MNDSVTPSPNWVRLKPRHPLLFFKTKQDVSIFDAVIFVAQSFKPKFSGCLKCVHA